MAELDRHYRMVFLKTENYISTPGNQSLIPRFVCFI